MRLIKCRKCGKAKDAQLFTPYQMKRKSAICRKCSSEFEKQRYIKAVVPADPGFRFSDIFNYGKESK